eukprot:10666317-Ditylum_brightwellii.AAC.1
MPNEERSLYVRLASKKLQDSYLYTLKQASEKGGIVCAFNKQSDGLFPAQDLARFDLEHWCFKELLTHWAFAEAPN